MRNSHFYFLVFHASGVGHTRSRVRVIIKASYLLQALQVDPFPVAFDQPVLPSEVVQLCVSNVHPVSGSSHRPGADRLLVIQETHSVLPSCTEHQRDLCEFLSAENQICMHVV